MLKDTSASLLMCLNTLTVCRESFCLQNILSNHFTTLQSHIIQQAFEAIKLSCLSTHLSTLYSCCLFNHTVVVTHPDTLWHQMYFSSHVFKNYGARIMQNLHSSSFSDEARCCFKQINPKHTHTQTKLQTELYALIWFCTREQDSWQDGKRRPPKVQQQF